MRSRSRKVGRSRFWSEQSDTSSRTRMWTILDIAQTSAEELAELVLERLLKELDLPPNVTHRRGRAGRGRGQTAWAKREVGI